MRGREGEGGEREERERGGRSDPIIKYDKYFLVIHHYHHHDRYLESLLK